MVGTQNILPELEVQVDEAGNQVNPSNIEKQNEIIAKMPVLESNGGVPVNVQDQTTDIVDVYFCRTLNVVTLASAVTLGGYSATFTAGHGFVAGNLACFKEGTQFFQAEVLVVATNVITIDRPFDFAFTAASVATRSSHEMNVDGSVTPVIFRVTPVGTTTKFDITRVVFHIEDNSVMDTATFGGLPALTKGVVLRKKDGTYKTVFNTKSNGGFSHHCDPIAFSDKAPSGFYGFRAIKTFGGSQNHGIVVRLDPALNDQIEVIVQDGLTGLTRFQCIAHGHTVQD